ncbi:LPXTG cell wall anchor domain-containing protein [Lactobacillus sp. CC-MHH1034]|uniref:LPXTG cell wall anchor domain-containing protein n=1 Tax=Agrilactobacillus fermenti TaxID=2586909 RepID=UPI001E43EC91|nr:LPXTG cell wall anchor domain-containing protein [Agrilactobacillus fermenti]MCD2256719.1 LPXTG cell wall anchor domain-containing protein [Agrilactobacillus fermenti]
MPQRRNPLYYFLVIFILFFGNFFYLNHAVVQAETSTVEFSILPAGPSSDDEQWHEDDDATSTQKNPTPTGTDTSQSDKETNQSADDAKHNNNSSNKLTPGSGNTVPTPGTVNPKDTTATETKVPNDNNGGGTSRVQNVTPNQPITAGPGAGTFTTAAPATTTPTRQTPPKEDNDNVGRNGTYLQSLMGRLPQTGEVQNYLLVVIGMEILIVGILIIRAYWKKTTTDS